MHIILATIAKACKLAKINLTPLKSNKHLHESKLVHTLSLIWVVNHHMVYGVSIPDRLMHDILLHANYEAFIIITNVY